MNECVERLVVNELTVAYYLSFCFLFVMQFHADIFSLAHRVVLC